LFLDAEQGASLDSVRVVHMIHLVTTSVSLVGLRSGRRLFH